MLPVEPRPPCRRREAREGAEDPRREEGATGEPTHPREHEVGQRLLLAQGLGARHHRGAARELGRAHEVAQRRCRQGADRRRVAHDRGRAGGDRLRPRRGGLAQRLVGAPEERLGQRRERLRVEVQRGLARRGLGDERGQLLAAKRLDCSSKARAAHPWTIRQRPASQRETVVSSSPNADEQLAAARATGSRSGLLKLFDLAKGGMGTVELALRREGEFRRLHAVKRLHPHLLEDEDLRAMFLDEARIAGLLRHANVVSVLDVGEDAQGPFLVMDYVDGVTLSTIIQHHAPLQQLLPVQLCARIGGEIARGLAAAHELTGHDGKLLDIVHRDVSPQNVLVGFDGQVRLADFGIARALGRSAKLTELGVIKGKIGYQAPEQLRF